MSNIVKHIEMASVELKDGEIIFIPASAMEVIASKQSGLVQIGEDYVNVFEIKRMRKVKSGNIEQAIFAYPKEMRDKLLSRRAKLKSELGRDFKDTSEVHNWAECNK